MHIAICDDHSATLTGVSALLEEYCSQSGNAITYETFNSATELLETIRHRQYDLLLLDILMPGVTGMDAAREIRQWDNQIAIIFLTSSPEFAVESYRVHAMDYILKPVQTENLFSALDKLHVKLAQSERFLTLKTTESLVRVPFSSIVCVEVMNRKLEFTLRSGEVKRCYGYLAEVEKVLLASADFMKPHRSYIVNLSNVTALDKSGFVTILHKTVPVARTLFVQTKTAYMKYLLETEGCRE